MATNAGNDPRGVSMEAIATLSDLNGNAARAIAAATAQIDLALREAHDPVNCLGQTLERIAAHMTELRGRFLTHTRNCGDAQGMLEMDLAVEKLAGEMAVAIQSMQFFDRMFQHLSHVHDYLTGGADNLARVASAPDAADVEEAAKRWEALRERLFSRLLSDAQRQVLDIVLPPQYWRAANQRSAGGRGGHAGPGDIELF
jgi:hypothetical protein